MPRTLFEKIWDAHLVAHRADGRELIYIDRHVLHELRATHAVPDSHASTVGGVGALAFGCGTTELAHILATQVMAMKRPKRMLVRLDGKLSPHVTAKDVALRIIAEIGVAGARGHVVEYA